MNVQKLIDSLDHFGSLLPRLIQSLPLDDARWKPPDGAWSILEVVCHLGDEEEFDFRTRVQSTLADPDEAWPPIDPEGWAVERRYNEQRLDAAVTRFVRLRQESVAWLRSLGEPDWSRTYQHPKFGPFRAGDIFAAWVAHDLLHLRQITKRLYQIVERDAGTYHVKYAGDWGA
jgi:hypothetical protein